VQQRLARLQATGYKERQDILLTQNAYSKFSFVQLLQPRRLILSSQHLESQTKHQ
jgi:hypothetical protein